MIAGPTELLIIADATARRRAGGRRHDRPGRARRGRRAAGASRPIPALAEALPAALEAALARAPRAAIARTALERNGLIVLVPLDARGHRGGQPAGAGASRDRRRGGGAGRERHPARRRHLPGRRHPRAGGRLPRRAQPRAADGRHRALRLAARRLRLRQADQRDPVHPGAAGGGRRGDHRAGGGGRAVRARGGGADPGGGGSGGGCGRRDAAAGRMSRRHGPPDSVTISPHGHAPPSGPTAPT